MSDGANIYLTVMGGIAAHNGREISLGGPGPQRIMALLILAEGDVVTTDRLADVTWRGEIDADRAEKNLHTYVSRIRARFGNDGEHVIGTRDRGYSLGLSMDSVDSHLFEASARAGFDALRRGQLRSALEGLDEARNLWANPPYGQFAAEEWAVAEVERLRELNRRVIESRAEALLRLGRVDDAVAAVEPILLDDPYREQPRHVHMLALHRSGRTVDALRSFEEYRVRLAEDVGTSPSEDMRALDRRIAAGSERAGTYELEVHVRGYQIHELIGQGTFAEVFRGTQPGLQRPVAVKAIRADLANSPEFIRGFEAEAAVISRLEHPRIVPLYDFWREPDRAFLVMRWLPGGSLETVLEDGPLEEGEALVLARHIGEALAVSHRAGIVHRDVKPANILLDGEGNYFLSDFGIAAELMPSRTTSAPEELEQRPITATTDQYQLAQTLVRALFPQPDEGGRDRPALGGVLMRAMSTDPNARYESIDVFVHEFTAALEDSPMGMQQPSSASIPPPSVSDPYVGLRSFEEHEHEVFHGRADLTAEMVERLMHGDRFLGVIGASGSGKSSGVRAGLLPEIRRGGVAGSENWFITTMTPGSHPFEALESALLRVATRMPAGLLELLSTSDRGIIRAIRRIAADSNETVLLVIDQFEEVFTLCEDEVRRRMFLDGLFAAISEPDSPLRVVLTLRADFYDHPLRYHGFAELIRDYSITITPLSPDELENAITLPAEQAGVSFERGLVGEMIATIASQPGGLPLLQHALSQLFAQRVNNVMTKAAYESIGGIDGAVARTAESLYLDSDAETQESIESMFSRLVTLGEGTEDTRRRTLRSDLHDSPDMDRAIESYVGARLVTVDRDLATREHTLEVAHEALIREWPRLRRLLDDNRAELRAHRQLGNAARQWELGDKAADYLYSGARLEAVESWLTTGPALNDSEARFIRSSAEEQQRLEEIEAQRLEHSETQNRRLRRLLSVVGVIAVLLLFAGGLAVQQRSRANAEARTATLSAELSESRRMAADAAQLVESDRRVALLLAAESHRRNPGTDSLGALQQALIGSDNLIAYLDGGTSYDAVAWVSHTSIAAATPTSLNLLSTTGDVLETVAIGGVRKLSSSADGALVAGATPDGLILLSTMDWSLSGLRRLPLGEVQSVAFSPDGALLAVGRRDGVVHLLNAETLEEIGQADAHVEVTLEDLGFEDAVSLVGQHTPQATGRGTLALAFDQTGERLASGGWGYSRIWSTPDLSLLGQIRIVRSNGPQDIVESVDAVGFVGERNERLVSMSRFAVIVGDASDGALETQRTDALRESIASTDITQLSSAAVGASRLISVVSGRVIEISNLEGDLTNTFDPHIADSRDLALHDDTDRVALASEDGVLVVSTNGDGLIRRFVGPATGNELGVSNSGELVAVSSVTTGTGDFLYRVLPHGVQELDPPGETPDFLYPHFGPGDEMLSYICAPRCGDRDRGARFALLDLRGERVLRVLPSPDLPGAAAHNSDGDLVAFTSINGVIFVVEVDSGDVLWKFDALESEASVTIRSLNFNEGATLLAASTEAGASAIFDLDTGEHRVISQGGGSTVQLNFGPGSNEFTTGSQTGEFVIRSLADLQPTGRSLIGPADSSGGPFGPTYTADGAILLSTNSARAQLIDVASGVGIGVPIPSTADIPAAPSSSGLFVVSSDGESVFRYDLDTQQWPEIACRAAGRNLTQVEWEKYGPAGEPYAATCLQYPALGLTPTEE